MAKYSAGPTMELDWISEGSTVVISFEARARGFEIEESMDAADATGYTNTNRQYVATIGDFQPSAELFLDDDDYAVEDLFTHGARGTLNIYPNGNVSTKKKISCPVFVSNRSRSYPFDDVAIMNVEWMPTGNKAETVVA